MCLSTRGRRGSLDELDALEQAHDLEEAEDLDDAQDALAAADGGLGGAGTGTGITLLERERFGSLSRLESRGGVRAKGFKQSIMSGMEKFHIRNRENRNQHHTIFHSGSIEQPSKATRSR